MTRRNSPSPLLNSPLLIIILPLIAVLFFFFNLSLKTRPTNSVKTSWDSLNIFLVLFAILCGVFARKNDDESTLNKDEADNNTRYHQFSDHHQPRKIYDNTPATGRSRLKRSSSSYPDLKQDSFWETGDDRSRFFDDFEISKYRALSVRSSTETEYNNILCHRHRRQLCISEEFNNVKEIPVDAFVVRPTPPPTPPQSPAPPPPRPPPPPPPPTTNRNQERRIYKSASRKEKEEKERGNDYGFVEIKTPPPTPPPPPPPPVVEAGPSMQKSGKSGSKKSSNATKEIKMVLASLYNQRKRKKKQKTKSLYVDGHYSPPQPTSSTRPPPSPPPPPPPPLPPPPSMFYSLFRKATKSKRIHSFSAPPPPPPPPPPPSLSTPKRTSKRKIHQTPPTTPPPAPATPLPQPSRRGNSSATGRPPLPTRTNNFYEENVNSGGQSPLIPMPPPPPPPPFRVPGFGFVVKGDFVKIRSAHSSRCSSPELEEFGKESTRQMIIMDGRDGKGGGPVFCPSPDVNIKADTFIARLRDEWKLEKINSMKEKRDMGHGPRSGP